LSFGNFFERRKRGTRRGKMKSNKLVRWKSFQDKSLSFLSLKKFFVYFFTFQSRRKNRIHKDSNLVKKKQNINVIQTNFKEYSKLIFNFREWYLGFNKKKIRNFCSFFFDKVENENFCVWSNWKFDHQPLSLFTKELLFWTFETSSPWSGFLKEVEEEFFSQNSKWVWRKSNKRKALKKRFWIPK